MTWLAIGGLAVGAIGSVVSSNKQAGAAKDAANTQAGAANAATALQKGIYDQNSANMQPFISAGTGALARQQQLLGLSGDGTQDFSSFFNSPDFTFAEQQGMANLDKSAAARGNLFSGGYGKDLVNYNQGLATQQYGNYYNKLMGLSQMGQTGASALAGVGQNYANQAGQNMQNAGTAIASGQLSAGNAQAGMYNQLGNIAGNFYQQYQNRAPQVSYAGNPALYGGQYQGPGAMQDYSQFTNPSLSSVYG